MEKRSNAFLALRILHNSLFVGLLFFAAVSLFLVKTGFSSLRDESFNRTLQVIALVLSVGALVMGFNIFKKRIARLRDENISAEQKMNQYRAACIGWWALIEGPGLFAIIGFLLTGNHAFLALAGFHILILGIFMPRRDNIIMLLNLNSDEVQRLEG